VLPVPTHSFASTTMTSSCTRGRKYAIPCFFVKSSQKRTTNRTQITIGGNRICYPGDVGTNTASLELLKLLLNSVLLRKGACFSSIDLKNFYLDTPKPKPEFVCIKILDIPQEFIDEYNLTGLDRDGWVYFKIRQGCYGHPQAGILANDLLQSCLEAGGFYEAASTPGLWCHKWRPIHSASSSMTLA
jgi:hypothetical protein